MDDGTHTWDSGNLEKVEASSVKASDVDSENANREIELTNTPSIPDPVSFATDSWATIQKAVKSGDYPYEVGDTKTITLAAHTNDCSSSTGSGATYACVSNDEPAKEVTIRVSNTSNANCTLASKTACGFVLEFVDVIEDHNMNSADATNTNGTNVGGWPASAMYKYLNPVEGDETSGVIFKALPSDLQEVISDTTVVSGHGSTSGEGNFTTTDKLYLLSAHEVFEDGTSNQVSYHDTSWNATRQLDYYAQNNVKSDDYSLAIKRYNGSYSNWWLRSAMSGGTNGILIVYGTGMCGA